MAQKLPTPSSTNENNSAASDNESMASGFFNLFSQFSPFVNQFTNIGRNFIRPDIGLAVGVLCILMVLMLPMPSWMLDISLAISITISIIVLMVALFIERPLDFNSFPTVLLICTSLRLALNVASTRLILSQGHLGTDAAGQVIEAFGYFIMHGNFLIGIIVFSILMIINFVVITKGSGRIAEVSARFTLDSMPGKQMAIDADLSSGLIDESTARQRRSDLEEESSFFGSMDGASKFVRGDAIAGILITLINIIAGIIIGTLQMDLSLSQASSTYTVLTVGDGLVSQLPALIISTAAGIVLTKGGLKGRTEKAIGKQLGGYPKALGIASFAMLIMSILPGVPFIFFFGIAFIMGIAAYYISAEQNKAQKQQELQIQAQASKEEASEEEEQSITHALKMDSIRLELGYGLLALLSDQNNKQIPEQIKSLRFQIASDMGFIIPSIRIKDNMQLSNHQYTVSIKDIQCGSGTLHPNMLLVINPKNEPFQIEGEPTKEPTFNLDALWIDPDLQKDAEFHEYTIVEPQTVMITHLTEIIKDHMHELLSYGETQKLLDELTEDQQKIVSDLIPEKVNLSTLQSVLQNLLKERISIRDIPAILEGISQANNFTQNSLFITEHVRTKLSRQISHQYADSLGILHVVALSAQWEQLFNESLVGQNEEKQLAMDPQNLQKFVSQIESTFNQEHIQSQPTVLLTSGYLRPYIRSILERVHDQVSVISQNELHPKIKIKTLGEI